jgi:hypothetical protein
MVPQGGVQLQIVGTRQEDAILRTHIRGMMSGIPTFRKALQQRGGVRMEVWTRSEHGRRLVQHLL